MDHRQHYNMEKMIQDNEGGTLASKVNHVSRGMDRNSPGAATIHHPPSESSSDNGDWEITDRDQDLVTQLMEENHTLKGQVDLLNKNLTEAAAANEQWFSYNAKKDGEVDQLRNKIKKLELNLHKEKLQTEMLHEELEKQKFNMNGDDSEHLQNRNRWLDRDNRLLREQLETIQSHLRKAEIRLGNGPLVDEPAWRCIRCTFENPGDNGKCEMCGMKAPERFPAGSGKLEIDGFLC